MSATEVDVVAALSLMRPRPCPVRLVRIGGRFDGAYLVPDDLEGVVACFSPGVNNVKTFEDQLAAQFGIRSHLCDFSSDERNFQTPLIPGMQTFEKKWLDVDGAPDSISLDEWVAAREPVGDLLLQMDIEGAEFRNILGSSGETLRRFRAIVMEVHDVNSAFDAASFDSTVGALMRRLDEDFVCVHAHPNNCCGEVLYPPTGMNLPGPIELTFLRRDRFEGAAAERLIAPSFPHPEDILRNVPGRAPLFLNGAWSDTPPTARSRRKRHEDHLDHLQHEANRLQRAIEDERARRRLAERAVRHENRPVPDGVGPVLDLAAGRPFRLSSALGGNPRSGVVGDQAPFFFHTRFGSGESITIDLGQPAWIEALEVTNRTDGCFDRARSLHACFHDRPRPDHDCNVSLDLAPEALWRPTGPQRTVIRPVLARYVTIFSPVRTALHLSAVRVMGRAVAPVS